MGTPDGALDVAIVGETVGTSEGPLECKFVGGIDSVKVGECVVPQLGEPLRKDMAVAEVVLPMPISPPINRSSPCVRQPVT